MKTYSKRMIQQNTYCYSETSPLNQIAETRTATMYKNVHPHHFRTSRWSPQRKKNNNHIFQLIPLATKNENSRNNQTVTPPQQLKHTLRNVNQSQSTTKKSGSPLTKIRFIVHKQRDASAPINLRIPSNSTELVGRWHCRQPHTG